MRLVVINPNTSASVTGTIAEAARRAAGPGTEIEAVSAPFGAAYIGTRGESVIAGHAVLEALAPFADQERCDAALIAAFTDPGLSGARELMPFPVLGMAEAAMLSACLLGGRFSIVTIIPRLVPVLREMVEAYGLDRRLASVRAISAAPSELAGDPAATARALCAIANAAVEEDGAEVIVLGGAPLAGMVDDLAARLPVPLLDGVACGVRLAEMLVGLGADKPRAGSFAPPPRKDMHGLAPALVQLYENDSR